jgi:cytochrome c oxidase cbb3-type subunit 3
MSARIIFLALAFLAVAVPVYGQTGSGDGAGAPPALIARGDSVFHGPGNCYACHGSKGEGLVGPSLIDAEWIHSKGTAEEIAAQVIKGIPKEQAKSGIPMPAKGGSSISDDDVKAVAAYVVSLSQKKQGT